MADHNGMHIKNIDSGEFGYGSSWLVTFYMNGKRNRRSFKTFAEAKEYVREIRAMLMSARKPPSKGGTGKFFNVDQFVAIMNAARPNERGMLAMAFLAGIRPLLLEKLSANCVDMVRRVIAIPSHFSKERRAHHLETESIHPYSGSYLPGLPSALWAWLEIYPFEPQAWEPMQKRIAGEIGFWHPDGCRKTAATYYNKLHGVAATMALLQLEGASRAAFHLRVGVVSRAEAERFYSINPADFLADGTSS